MAKWIVYGRVDDTASCVVEANSREEAMQKARNYELEEEWEDDSPFLRELVVVDAREFVEASERNDGAEEGGI